jgi:hypothetical protein
MQSVGLIVLFIILLVMFVVLGSPMGESLVSKFTGQDAPVASIATRDAQGDKYAEYLAIVNNPPLSAWQFERLMGLAKKKQLTASNIDVILSLA